MTTATTVKSSSNATRSFVNAKLPDLDYDFAALEPVICAEIMDCLLYTSPSPRDKRQSRMPSSA